MIIDQISLLTRLPQEWGLNSRGLKRICSDSSSWTFGIQGENLMKSRDEIVIIMLQWIRLYTLGSRGSRKLKTFLEIRLISSRIDQKLKNKEGKYMLLKRNSWPDFQAVWCDRGGGLMATIGRGTGLLSWWRSWPQSHGKSASIAGRSGHNQTEIVSHDRWSSVSAAVRWRSR